MSNSKHYRLLGSKFFLLCLFILLLNDFFLKKWFPGILTGKLSDFAGLFIFPFFFSAIFPSGKKIIYFLTMLLFILWKLPASDFVLSFLNSFKILTFYRVKDLSDLIAIMVLPLSYIYYNSELKKSVQLSRLQLYSITFLSLFGFTATSCAPTSHDIGLKVSKTYSLDVKKQTFLNVYTSQTNYTDLIKVRSSDSSFYLSCRPKSKYSQIRITYSAFIKKLGNDSTEIIVDSVVSYEVECDPSPIGCGNDRQQNTLIKKVEELDVVDYVKFLDDNIKMSIGKKELGPEERIWYTGKRVLDSLHKINRITNQR